MSQYTQENTSKFVQTKEWKLHYNEAGSGDEVVIMLHGSGAGATGWANFHRNVDAFVEAGYRVILPDYPGWGKSDSIVTGEPRFDVNGRATLQLMDALDIDKAHLVGNSMGGGSALALTTRHPERVGKLILMGAGGVGKTSIFTPLPMEGIKLLFDVYKNPSIESLRRMLDVFVYDPSALTDELIELRYKAMMENAHHLPNFLKSVEMSQFNLGDYTNELPKIPNKTLITWGRDDRFVPIDWSLKFLNMIPNSTLHVFSQCGHWAQWEHAEPFNRLVIDFIKH
ncbi:alpha/beta fold hydrolase [Halopseudomonas phragmitis]|uniref:2-hydroxy-6-oxo-6-phenylhexa-2,4-dienoate hydrolase n=1 Tax=Halopseudomonas phragmitis TaxID=1931241 RepID=A0A1V0B8G3_9GAMM|nr:alpha/beta fold hydrolase [Halopseudomonas phragmitis]AQZ96223.1 2-hydroxy-6-oxo-6-phenylhexa-2,4-dienoate hydrolase [Halopseudomonas phragmitis]